MAETADVFDRNVFINCPFDDQYLELLRPLLFTLVFLGYTPRIASERSDSLESRIEKICCLILEKDQHDFKRALSDIAGIDIKSHGNQPVRVVRAVRNWFYETVGVRNIEGASAIWYRFTDFASDFYDQRQTEGYSDDDLNMMPVGEYVDFIRGWLVREH